jgi:DnaJ-domain-containing protein 1
MIWIGPLVGAFLFSRGGLLGMLIGSLLGAWIERRLRYGSRSAGRRGAADAPRREGKLAKAYRTLGLRPGASKAAAKRAYHELAKKCHPDVLRASGAGEREIAEATERMTRLNAAWDLISSQNS